MSAAMRELAITRIVARCEGDWRLATLAVLALPEVVEDALHVVGRAMRKARTELGTNPVHSRQGTSLADMPAADESQRRYEGPDAVYAVRERDIHQWTLQEAMNALQKTLWHLPDEQFQEAREALEPLMVMLVRKGLVSGDAPRSHNQLAARFVEEGRRKALARVGTVASTKAKRMKPPVSIPTSGPASRPVVLKDPAQGRTWVVHEDRYDLVEPALGTAHLLNTGALAPVRVGTERREQSDDILADLKRPVRAPGRNSGKQKGRVGGPMITRGGRP
jgi:hypothetical protein